MKGKNWVGIVLGVVGFLIEPLQADTFAQAKKMLDTVDGVGRKVCPSDLKGSPGKVIILAETNHNDEAVIRLREEEIVRAGKGEYFLGIEGDIFDPAKNSQEFSEKFGCDPQKSRAFGLDDPFVKSTIERVFDHVDLYRAVRTPKAGDSKVIEKQQNALKSNLLLSLMDNDTVREAWASTEKNGLSPELVSLVDRLIQTRSVEGARISAIREFRGAHRDIWKQGDEFIKLSQNLTEAVIKNAESPQNKRKYGAPDLVTARKLLSDPESKTAESDFIYDVDVEWRRDGFANRIRDLYNQAKGEGKDLKVIVGQLHAKGLADALQKRGLQVAINTVESKGVQQ